MNPTKAEIITKITLEKKIILQKLKLKLQKMLRQHLKAFPRFLNSALPIKPNTLKGK